MSKKFSTAYYGITDENGNIDMLHSNDGTAVTKLDSNTDPLVWPVGSDVSGYYEHAAGIKITASDATLHGLSIE